jgi:uncharacterized damage-inducible protein DinB
MSHSQNELRRSFLKAAIGTTGALALSSFTTFELTPQDKGIHVFGPRPGYAPQLSVLVSMMDWMRAVILTPIKGLTIEQLDYLHDEKSNSIGSMLLHLAATERFYQIHTLENKKWGDWPEKDKARFDVAMKLGDEGRKKIKGNDLNFYLSTLEEVRSNTLQEFKKRDDNWLMRVDNDWGWGPTNNYCKWFHVCEHESNHNGQIKWIKSRLPGANAATD